MHTDTAMKLHSILVLLVAIGSSAYDFHENIEKAYIEETMLVLDECGYTEIMLCLKERVLQYVAKLPNSLVIGGGFSVKPNHQGDGDRSARLRSVPELPEELRAREDAIDKILTDRVLNYFASHTLEFKVPDVAVKEFKRSIEEGRKKKKKHGIMPYLLLFKMKIATVMALALKALAAIAFKALVIAKIALTISIIIGLKKLTESKPTAPTYEVLAHDEHGHYRSFEQDLAYGAYKDS